MFSCVPVTFSPKGIKAMCNKRIPGPCACCVTTSGCQGVSLSSFLLKLFKFSTEGFEISGYLSLADDLCPHLYT